MSRKLLLLLKICTLVVLEVHICRCDVPKIGCDENYEPKGCNFPDLPLKDLYSVDDFCRCAPALLPKKYRNLFWAATGEEITYFENEKAFKRIRILNGVLRDVTHSFLSTKVLDQWIAFPVGVAPTAGHKMAHLSGEAGTAKAVAAMNTVMIVSSFSTTSLEDVAAAFGKGYGHLWMQTYLFENRTQTKEIVRRAEKAGYEAIVLTVDSNIEAKSRCGSKGIYDSTFFPNFDGGNASDFQASATFKDLKWLVDFTKLPVIPKGILTGHDAILAVRHGAAAILVSNHGGRQLDSVPATIDVLPEVVSALKKYSPKTEVYMDGGVRSGNSVFKALLLGAKAVFVGRPIIWGLTAGGEEGVKKVLTILKDEFNETMLIAGYTSPEKIRQSKGTEIKL